MTQERRARRSERRTQPGRARRASAYAFVLYALLLSALAASPAEARYDRVEHDTSAFSGEELVMDQFFPDHAVPVGADFVWSVTAWSTATAMDSVTFQVLSVTGDCYVRSQTNMTSSTIFVTTNATIRMTGASCSMQAVAEAEDSGGGLQGPSEARGHVSATVVSFTMHDFGQDPADAAWGRWFAVAVAFGLFMFGALMGAWFVLGFGAAALVGQLFFIGEWWATPEGALLLGAVGIALEAFASDKGKVDGGETT